MPLVAEPPIQRISGIRFFNSGSFKIAWATLVSGPKVISEISSFSIKVRIRKSAPCSFSSFFSGSRISISPMPPLPWTSVARTSWFNMGISYPAYTGISGRPVSSVANLAFLWVYSSPVLPPTATIPRTSRWRMHRIRANISSIPGSQSMITFRFVSIIFLLMLLLAALLDLSLAVHAQHTKYHKCDDGGCVGDHLQELRGEAGLAL